VGEPLLKPKKRKKKKEKFSKELYLEVIERDKCCIMCGSYNWLQVHHVKYRSQGGKHELDNLVLLCKEHHDLVHSNKRKFVPILEEYIKNKKENE